MIKTLHLFRPLNIKLMELLRSLSPADWDKKTVAGNWTVKDVTAHLLDTNMRFISIYRDGVELVPDQKIERYTDLVAYLNRLNGDWVTAMKRVSPALLIEMHDATHEGYVSLLEQLDPQAPAKFGVAWAGEDVSPNWFHIARDLTEKWHHQQQLRDALHTPGILTTEYYTPVMNTFMRAWPFRYRDVPASAGTCIELSITSPEVGRWHLLKEMKGWMLAEKRTVPADVVITLPADISWKLFTKAVPYETVKDKIGIAGDVALAMPLLRMITVMA